MATHPLVLVSWTFDDQTNTLVGVFTDGIPERHSDPVNFVPTKRFELTFARPTNVEVTEIESA